MVEKSETGVSEVQHNETEGGSQKIDYSNLSVRDSIKESIKEIQDSTAEKTEKAASKGGDSADKPKTERQRDELGRFAEEKSVPAVDKQQKAPDIDSSQTSGTQEATTSEQQTAATTAAAAPASWSKDKHQLFASLAPDAQNYILQREHQMQEGVQQLKKGYEEIDAAVTPYREMIRRYGQTPGHTIRQLFEWNAALAGPNKAEAFRQLAQRFQIDLSQLAPQRQPQAMPGNGQQGVSDPMEPVIQDIRTWQQGIEAQLHMDRQSHWEREVQRAQTEISRWAAGKPHFERVRLTMQELVGLDQAAVSQGMAPRHGVLRQDGSVDLDRAYAKAVALDDELVAQVKAEEQTKREADARQQAADKAAQEASRKQAEADRAKKAGVSLKSGAAAGSTVKPAAGPKPGESVRETIQRSIREARGG